MDFKLAIGQKILDALKATLGDPGMTDVQIASALEVPPDTAMGDFAFPCFKLSKALRKPPAMISDALAGAIQADFLSKVDSVKGYLNFFIDRATFAEKILRAAGRVERVEERLFDAFSAVAGCSPAFIYLFLEALADGGVLAGLPRKQAVAFAAQAMAGSAALVLESGEHPGALKDAVCSPGGSTIEGVAALERHGFRGAVMDAVEAAWSKSASLGKQ